MTVLLLLLCYVSIVEVRLHRRSTVVHRKVAAEAVQQVRSMIS